jgi:Fe-S-cluster containining protein
MRKGKRVLGMLQPKGRCVFLTKENRCSIYEARPMTCRGYPFSIHLDAKLRIVGIDCHRSTKDAFACNALAIPDKHGHMVKDTIREEKEDKAYWKKCATWNMGNRKRTFKEFLSFMGLGNKRD